MCGHFLAFRRVIERTVHLDLGFQVLNYQDCPTARKPVTDLFLHARHGLNLTRETTHSETTLSTEPRRVSDAEFRRSLANCSSWRTADYFWEWHKAFPHMTLADMHAKIEADRAAAEAAEWEAEQAYADRFERSEAELLAEQADLEEAEEAAWKTAWEAAHPELVAEVAAARVIIAEAHVRIAEAEETERVARAAMEAAEKAFVEAAPETHTETSTEIYFFLQDTLRIAYEMAREATAEARHPGLAAAAAAAQAADELAHLEGAGEGGDLDEARELITAIPPRGRPAAAADAEEEELFASSTSSPAVLASASAEPEAEAEEDDAAEADWYDQKERERSGP